VPRTKQRTPELRDQVLAVALALLAQDGVGGFTTRRVARAADTSTPAVYELFGDKGGLVRDVFFEGFRRLRRSFDALADSDDPRAGLLELVASYRTFMRENPELAQVMFARPFTDFEPGPSELEASSSVRIFIVERVGRAVDAGVLDGDKTDLAHVLVSLVQGLAAAEHAGRLGTSPASIDRRWTLGVNALLDGLGPSARPSATDPQ
jgi:AcrR family transcriptional regulator